MHLPWPSNSGLEKFLSGRELACKERGRRMMLQRKNRKGQGPIVQKKLMKPDERLNQAASNVARTWQRNVAFCLFILRPDDTFVVEINKTTAVCLVLAFW